MGSANSIVHLPALCVAFSFMASCAADTTPDPCADSPCFPGVACTLAPSTSAGFQCGPCPEGYEGDGKNCGDIDGCAGVSCFSGAACVDIPAPGEGFDCGACPAGYSGDGATCIDTDGCAGISCFSGATCVDIPAPGDGFDCGACPDGYTGDGASCSDFDGCSYDPCYPGVSCSDVAAPGVGFQCGDCPGVLRGDGIHCAKVLHVDAGVVGGLGDGSSWANAFDNLQDALGAASGTGPWEIWVAAGTYLGPFSLREGVSMLGGFAGTEASASQRNWSDNPTVLSGDLGVPNDFSDNTTVVRSWSVDETAVLDGFIVAHGRASGSPGVGGGMRNEFGNPTIANCTFVENISENGGGGMYNNGGRPTITNCTFLNNVAKEGGGMMNFGSDAVVTNCAFVGNRAIGASGGGGGMNNTLGSPVVVNAIFAANVAYDGGAIRGGSLTIINATFAANAALRGGAVTVSERTTPSSTVENSVFVSNSGDIWDFGGYSNQSYCCATPGFFGDGNISNCDAALVNAPLSALRTNAAGDIDSLQFASHLIAVDDIVVVNNDGVARTVTAVTAGGIIFTPPLANASQAGDHVSHWAAGTADLSFDLRPAVFSPCIDAGDNSALPADLLDLDVDGNIDEWIPFDLDGNPRIDGPAGAAPVRVDIGAYEL